MHIQEIVSRKHNKKVQRIGRGGKRGTYSGRGQKGQKSRSGHRIPSAERTLMIRIPKLRGIKNKVKRPAALAVSLSRLAAIAEKVGGTVTPKTLTAIGVIRTIKTRVKVLATGTISIPVTIEGIQVSAVAREKITKAGGMVK